MRDGSSHGGAALAGVGPQAQDQVGPVFVEQWHAQVLGVANVLVEQGQFTADAWSNALGAALATRAKRTDDSHQIYYEAALEALESLVATSGAQRVNATELSGRVGAWREAYLSTPHGEPVMLPESSTTD